ncbi:saccharopine dehydrogenase family protein [Halalkalibacter sp. APA_J-10(15)]|uniref:saccharopine dehydrogenase family protein n=1 Tax=Halalkalibacter sp. APA_J-10(15) TaxID=2933805 RepID=UPI001FF17B3A|nr:saccharopine dehydrogenase NADP-binding domain-containing protein [Halalkalibacter sp. APA_J-10(15)]MCK0471774.1 saccharopine dehydrogenase NADP-binding domain-containing protein [Halalkalibacter sp. APA_J-10(15)]
MIMKEIRDKIIVIGGYGHVGRKVCRQLANDFPSIVYAAGRNEKKAKEFAQSTNGKVLPLYIDVSEGVDPALLHDVRIVIMCVEQTSTDFVVQCLKHGITYIDITASYSFIEQVEKLNDIAIENEATALLSVGLAPGISNLLATWAAAKLDTLTEMNLFIMLGLGDEHGREAIRWTLQQTKETFKLREKEEVVSYPGFTDGKATDFVSQLNKRNAYRFNFADQHVLGKRLDIPVSTRLCFDSRFVTQAVHLLKVSRLVHLFPEALLLVLFEKLQWGSSDFAVCTEVIGMKDGQKMIVKSAVHGKEEAEITASVTSMVAKKLYEGVYSSGVMHIEQLFQWGEVYKDLQPTVRWEREAEGV